MSAPDWTAWLSARLRDLSAALFRGMPQHARACLNRPDLARPFTGDLAKRLRTPREFDFGSQWDFIIELPQDWGNRLLEGTNKTLCAPRPRRKEQCPHKRLTQTCLWVSKSLRQRRGSAVACCRGRGTECSSVCMGPLNEVTIIFITSTIF